MKAYKCDRCGRLYEQEWKPEKIKFDGNNSIYLKKITFIKTDGWSETPDLCRNCMNSFMTWWNLEQENV